MIPWWLRFQGNFPTFQAEEEEEEDDAVQEPETASETGPQRPQDFQGFGRKKLQSQWFAASMRYSFMCCPDLMNMCVILCHILSFILISICGLFGA